MHDLNLYSQLLAEFATLLKIYTKFNFHMILAYGIYGNKVNR